MKLTPDMHFIRKHILRVLTYSEGEKFSKMRPDRVDSNLYSYHLKQLVKEGYIEHDKMSGYRLAPAGMRFVDHVSLETFEPRWQPKLLTMLVVINDGQIWLWPKYKQPFMGSWSLPSGKVHYNDSSVEAAALREASYLSEKPPLALEHRGVVEFVAGVDSEVVSHTVAHIFMADIARTDITHPKVQFKALGELDTLRLSPGTREIIQATLEENNFFYKTLSIDW